METNQKTCLRLYCELNVFNWRISVKSHLAPGCLHGKKTFEDHNVIK